MGIYLNPSNSNFQESLNSEIYVDKSGLIAYTNSIIKTQQKNICVSRPRRFGKSMAADMLCAYYSRGCNSREMFQGLKISRDTSFEKHLNKYTKRIKHQTGGCTPRLSITPLLKTTCIGSSKTDIHGLLNVKTANTSFTGENLQKFLKKWELGFDGRFVI